MLQGVNDVLPSSVFDSLTAEDLHLLMNGSPVVDVEILKKITSFMDESRECLMTSGAIIQKGSATFSLTSPVCAPCQCCVTSFSHVSPLTPHIPSALLTDQPGEAVTRFKQWFWAVVEKMTNEEKHDLVRQKHTPIAGWWGCGIKPTLGSWNMSRQLQICMYV